MDFYEVPSALRPASSSGAAERGLDMPLRMDYGRVSGVSPRQGLGTAGLKTLRGGMYAGPGESS